MNYLLDSDVLISFFNKRAEAVELVKFLSQEGNLYCSILTISELRAGWNKKQAKVYLTQLYDLLEVKRITKKIAELAGEVRHEYKTRGQSLPTVDTLIAATTIIGNYNLVTGNKKHYPMPQIKHYSN